MQNITISCVAACRSGTYGENCNKTCSNCMNGTCKSVDGDCNPSGCKAGWEGSKCEQGIKNGFHIKIF